MIVAQHSGIARVLDQYCGQEGYEAKFIVDTRLSFSQAVDSLTRAIMYFLVKPASSRHLGRYLRDKLAPHCSWTAAARSFLQEIVPIPSPSLMPAENVRLEIERIFLREAEYVDNLCLQTTGKSLNQIFLQPSLCNWEGVSGQGDTVTSKSVDKWRFRRWSELMAENRSTMILGGPGSGKTLCLRYEVNKRCLQAAESIQEGSTSDNVTGAIYCPASMLFSKFLQTGQDLGEIAIDLLCERHSSKSSDVRKWLREELHGGRILLAIDALDEFRLELSEEKRKVGETLLAQSLFSLTYRTSVSAIFSSRPLSRFKSLLPGTPYVLLPFSSRHVRSFIYRWFVNDPQTAEQLNAQLKGKVLATDVLQNPLLLTLTCQLVETSPKKGQLIPLLGRRCDLYDLFLVHLKQRWIERLSSLGQKPSLSEQEVFLPFVEEVVWWLWRNNSTQTIFSGFELVRAIDAVPKVSVLQNRPDLLSDMCESGILLPLPLDDSQQFIFLHRSLMEFLAASCAARHVEDPNAVPQLEEFVLHLLDERSNHNFLWMLVSKYNNQEPFINQVLKRIEQMIMSRTSTLDSPVFADFLSDCLYEIKPLKLSRSTRNVAWEIITQGLDRSQRRVRKKNEDEWSLLVSRQLLNKSLLAVQVHDGINSKAQKAFHVVSALLGQTESPHLEVKPEFDIEPLLLSTSSVVRWAAIWLVTHFVRRDAGFKAPTMRIKQMQVNDPSLFVRCIATRALGELLGPTFGKQLYAELRGTSSELATAAAIAYGRLRTPESVEILISAAKDLLKSRDSKDDALSIAVIGSLEYVAARGLVSQGMSGRTSIQEWNLPELFLSALHHPIPQVKSSAASALGKLNYIAAWTPLKALLEQSSDSITTVVRAAACYACDQLTHALEESTLAEASEFFRNILSNRMEELNLRRPASSGLVKVVRRGFRSQVLVNDLLESAEDTDRVIAKNCLLALLQFPSSEILFDLTLLILQMDSWHRILLAVNISEHPSKTGLLILHWMLKNENPTNVLASSLHAAGEAFDKASDWKKPEPPDFVTEVELISQIVELALELADHKSPVVVASAQKCVGDFAQLVFAKRLPLTSLIPKMLAKTRKVILRKEAIIQASAASVLSRIGNRDDLETLDRLKSSPEPTVKKSAHNCYTFLNNRLEKKKR